VLYLSISIHQLLLFSRTFYFSRFSVVKATTSITPRLKKNTKTTKRLTNRKGKLRSIPALSCWRWIKSSQSGMEKVRIFFVYLFSSSWKCLSVTNKKLDWLGCVCVRKANNFFGAESEWEVAETNKQNASRWDVGLGGRSLW
jgi:hypothetical protein